MRITSYSLSGQENALKLIELYCGTSLKQLKTMGSRPILKNTDPWGGGVGVPD